MDLFTQTFVYRYMISICLSPFLLFGNTFCLQGSAYDCVLYENERIGRRGREDKGARDRFCVQKVKQNKTGKITEQQ